MTRGLWLLGLMILIALPAAAQRPNAPAATSADYARADSVFLARRPGLLLNRVVIPHWLDPTDQFWYRHERTGGFDFLIVDAATGRARPAFDPKAIATALAATAGDRVVSDSIPLDSLTLAKDGNAPGLAWATVKGSAARCRLSSSPIICDRLPPVAANLLPSPDGRRAVFTRDGNLWLKDLDGGTERALTTDGAGDDFGYGIPIEGIGTIARQRARELNRPAAPPAGVLWSPDGRTLIVPRIDQRHVAQYPLLETVPADGSFRPKVHFERRALLGERPATLELFAIDVATGTVRGLGPSSEEDWYVPGFRQTWWSADSKHLFGLALLDNETVARLVDIEIATGQSRIVTEERLPVPIALNSSGYNAPNFQVTATGAEVIWWSERDGWGHLYLYDAATGRLKNRITEGPWLVRDLLAVDEAARQIYFTAGGREPGNPYYRHIYRVGFDGRGLTHLSPEAADHNVVSPGPRGPAGLDGGVGYRVLSPSGKYLVYTFSTPDRPPETVIRRTADARLVETIERADPSRLYAVGYRPPEEFTAKAADGVTDLWGVIYRPARFDSTLSYPLIDAQYTTPVLGVAPRNFASAVASLPSGDGAAFAQLGFVTVVVDSRGTGLRDRSFNQAMFGRLDLMGLDDHVAVIRELARRYPFIDTTRVGITGDSFGGWSTVRALLTYPEIFKVGVAGNAPGAFHNMYSFARYQGAPVYDSTRTRPTATAVAKNYQAVDTRQLAGRLQGKLLMMISELDENVLPGSSLQLVDAFLRADRNVDVIYLPDTGHGFGKYTGHVIRRKWDYFVHHLQGVEPPPYQLHFP